MIGGTKSFIIIYMGANIQPSLLNLARRLRQKQDGTALSFDKDDEDALDFVTATANLRAWAYGIPTLTRWQVKGE